jgi:DNA mismatch endonuclease (patch repair protein)
MTDVLSKEQRKHCMSKIKSKDTKPEMLVRRFLFSHGFRFRLHRKDLPGNPDIVLPKFKTVIFINGCFWHGHRNCKFATIPETNRDFWLTKISGNIIRDNESVERLKQSGWRVIVIWQCELKSKVKDQTLEQLITKLQNE